MHFVSSLLAKLCPNSKFSDYYKSYENSMLIHGQRILPTCATNHPHALLNNLLLIYKKSSNSAVPTKSIMLLNCISLSTATRTLLKTVGNLSFCTSTAKSLLLLLLAIHNELVKVLIL